MDRRTHEPRSLPLVLVALLAACSPAERAAGQESWKTDFDRFTVPLEEIASGGPPKDGIPAIDQPRFIDVRRADRFLGDNEPVAVVRLGGAAKVYPIQILIWHEIVNDVVGGEPVSVTYCPLCNTTLAFDRRFEGDLLDFGTTGRLRHSDMVMYDRQTETWWQQATGEGIVGEHAGKQLTFVPSPVMRWVDVKEQHPDARVLSRETGYERNYGRNPYQGYDRRKGPFLWAFKARRDEQLPQMERVVALHEGGESWAVPFSALKSSRVAHLTVGGSDVVVLFTPETASSVDEARIRDGRAVGSSAVYSPVVDGRSLRFVAAEDGGFSDTETGSLWNVSGHAVAGPLAGTRLSEIPHGNHFWFAWAVFRPETRIWRP